MAEHRQAAQALASVRVHQERARRAARLPWWVYAAAFVLSAATTAADDFVSLDGTKLIAILVSVVLVAALLIGAATGSAPLSLARGVQPQQSFAPKVFVFVAIVGGVGGWLISRYGTDLAHGPADGIGLGDYPNTVAGVIYGAAFTASFALTRLLTARSQRSVQR